MRYMSVAALLALGFSIFGLAAPISNRDVVQEIDQVDACSDAEPVAHGTINSRDGLKPRCDI
ncbi:hypothetical protein AB5N19_03764 [Seiridium cardinale]|uniref:Uncharacterized protein n=1 Tax=Seiridium cardinale TaxID=138064 RepID=A0ABR2Y2Y7_9PEZI